MLDDTQYCFELFRRALVDHNQQAYELVYTQYKGMVTQWVKSRLHVPYINEDVEECVNWAFASMFSSVSKEGNFGKFPALNRLLSYLQSCAYSAAAGKNRKSKVIVEELVEELGDDTDLVEDILDEEKKKTARSLVETNLKSGQEWIVYEEYFEWGFMPKQIYARHPDKFLHTQEVSRVKQILLERLERIFRRDWKDDEA